MLASTETTLVQIHNNLRAIAAEVSKNEEILAGITEPLFGMKQNGPAPATPKEQNGLIAAIARLADEIQNNLLVHSTNLEVLKTRLGFGVKEAMRQMEAQAGLMESYDHRQAHAYYPNVARAS